MVGCVFLLNSLEDIGDKFQGDEERHMPQHVGALAVADLPFLGCPFFTDMSQVHIEGETEEQIEVATELIMPLPPWSLAQLGNLKDHDTVMVKPPAL